MNRMEEYEAMLAQLAEIPEAASGSVTRAKARRNRNRLLWRPLTAAAVLAVCFVGLVNLCPPVAAACMEVPFLARLAEAVSFSPSLQRAVEHEYAQVMNLEQTQNGITARVEYLIVDQKQVEIFYSLASEAEIDLSADAEIRGREDGLRGFGVVWSNTPGLEDSALRRVTVSFTDGDVPDALWLDLKVYEQNAPAEPDAERDDLAGFSFLLEFDPQFTAQGRTVEVNQTVELDGQTFTVTTLEIYPTHLRLNVAGDPENTAWLKALRFYLELSDGTHVDPSGSGIIAAGTADSPAMQSFYAESIYFFDADAVRLAVTGADFMEKDRVMVYVNLKTGETDPLPQGVALDAAVQTQQGWEVAFRVDEEAGIHAQVLAGDYYDAAGERYACSGYTVTNSGSGFQKLETYCLDGYWEDEVWLVVNFTYFWDPPEPVFLELP